MQLIETPQTRNQKKELYNMKKNDKTLH
jgi:hypothetical protein